MLLNPFILFFLIVVLMALAVLIGLSLGNVFTKTNTASKDVVCDFTKCNEQLSNWIKQQRGDIHNSSKQFAECKACPERSYSQLTNEVQKYKMWKRYKTPEEAIHVILV
jgi:cell shape-determining protein MreC